MRRIVVVGGGYAGFYTAWGLEKRLGRSKAGIEAFVRAGASDVGQ